jgi:hypothetical protein
MRWVRGALFIGFAWAVGWIVVMGVVLMVISIVDPPSIDPGEAGLRVFGIIALLGLLCGMGFSTVLTLAERKNTLQKLSLWRVAIWGAIGSVAIPVLMGTNGSMWPITAILGAVFAVVTLLLARAGANRAGLTGSHDQRSLDHGDEFTENPETRHEGEKSGQLRRESRGAKAEAGDTRLGHAH